MIAKNAGELNKALYYRLISLWVICEAFAGGIMHSIKLPFSGMIISSLAVTCIILIAYYVPDRSAIIKATLIVAVFKLVLSPYSPPTAYIAVFFQGFMGQVLLRNKRCFTVSAIVVAVLALVESAIQRLLVLVIIYGNGLVKAINIYIQKLLHEKNLTNYSLALALSYVLIHAIVGIAVGIYALKLAKNASKWKTNHPELVFDKTNAAYIKVFEQKKRRHKLQWLIVLTWVILILLYIQSWLHPMAAILPAGLLTGMLIRSVFIVLTWYILLAPLAMFLIKKILQGVQQKKKSDIKVVMLLVPESKYIFQKSLDVSGRLKGIPRIKLFFKILMINVLAD